MEVVKVEEVDVRLKAKTGQENEEQESCTHGAKQKDTSKYVTEQQSNGDENGCQKMTRDLAGNNGHNSRQRRRGNYHKFTPQEKSNIGQLAVAVGSTRAMRQLQTQNPGLKLAESTVRSFKTFYLKEMAKNKKTVEKRERKQRGKYRTYTAQERATIGKFAFENGNMNALKVLKEDYPGLSESTVRGFKNMFKEELEKRTAGELQDNGGLDKISEVNRSYMDKLNLVTTVKFNEDSETLTDKIIPITSIANEINNLPRKKRKKRARPDRDDPQIKETIIKYLQAIAEKDSNMLNTKAVIAIAKGVIMTENRSLLFEFGGDMVIDKTWATSFLKENSMIFGDRISNTKDIEKNADNLAYILDNESSEMVQGLHESQITIVSYDQSGNENGSSTILVLPRSESDIVIPVQMTLDNSAND
ncbi:uncharacterized protein LOC135694739 [Rhopilema esculentum]|uniref:uncharacterized protein LOC135694739 n=1 Tax=Rhopilema esculentum TaxID=499914 RepID=UPI0031D8DB1D|eukprot:gene4497-20743_t